MIASKFPAEYHSIPGSLVGEATLVCGRITEALKSYAESVEAAGLLVDDEAYLCATALSRQLDAQLTKMKEYQLVYETRERNSTILTGLLQSYRTSLVLRSSIVRTLSWASTAYNQSLYPFYFWNATTGYATNRFNYDRAGGYRQEELGEVYLKALGIEPEGVSPLVTASCMSALSLIERHIVGTASEFPIRVLLPRKVYFETQFAYFANPRIFDVRTFDAHETEQVMALLEEVRPHVVVLESLQNFHGMRLINVAEILERMSEQQPDFLRHVVIDESALPGLFDPFKSAPVATTGFHLYLVSSCSKYMQLGFDMIPVGIIVTSIGLRTELRRIGAAAGFLAPETSTWMVPQVTRQALSAYLSSVTEVACKFTSQLSELVGAGELEIAYPLLGTHPANSLARTLPYIGGLITCRAAKFASYAADIAATHYHSAIKDILLKAGEAGISIGDSEGFGFNDPRIHLCKWPNEVPFVRFAFGVLPDNQIEQLARICAATFAERGMI